MKQSWQLAGWFLMAAAVAGCGRGDAPTSSNGDATDNPATVPSSHVMPANRDQLPEATEKSGVLPTAGVARSGNQPSSEKHDDDRIVEPEKNSPEWFILRITQIKLRPLQDADDQEKVSQQRRERNQQIVDLATEAIARTHNVKSKERIFDLSVHHLLEAELQLALAGDRDHIDALYEHASSLYQRNPKSKSAVEAGQSLIAFARLNTQRFGRQESKWLEEYARLARQFAKNFPLEERQAIPMLLAAGQSCDFHGLTGEAIQCYATIREQFPESPAAERVTPILRRLNLKGKPLKLAGPTIGGGFVSVQELLGKTLLVVCWTTQAQPFVRQLPALQDLLTQIEPERLTVVGVNLDDDDNESAVQTFLETNGLNWPTILHTEPGERGWNNPIATYYGIQSVPQYWLVSSQGNVVETANDLKQIEPLLRKLIAPPSAAEK
jgi:hypothetical protein